MPQFFRIEVDIPAQPEHSWVKTLSRFEVLHLRDSQGTPISLDSYLRFWCSRFHLTDDRFECDYGADPALETPYKKFMGTAL